MTDPIPKFIAIDPPEIVQAVNELIDDINEALEGPPGSGNVSNTGTPTAGQLAVWTDAFTIQGSNALSVNNLNGGAGAAQGTFWQGNGAWAAPIGAPITRAQISTMAILPATFMVSGFSTTGDLGAGAIYSSQAAGPSSPMAIQNASGTWYGLVITGPANVGWFGAVGDGATNDTAAIQAAIDWATAQLYGASVLINNGIYIVQSSLVLKNGVTLYSNSDDTWTWSSGGRPRLKAGAGMTTPLIKDNGVSVSGAAVKGLYLIGAGVTFAQDAMNFTSASGCNFENLRIENFGKRGIVIAAGAVCSIRRVYMVNTGGIVSATLSGSLDIGGTEHRVSDCEIGANVPGVGSGSKLSANLFNNSVVCRGSGIWFTNVFAEFAEIGVVVTGSGQGNNKFVYCVSDNCVAHGVKVESGTRTNVFIGHQVQRCGHDADNTYDGYWVQGIATRLMGCVVTGFSDANRLRYGFNDDSSSGFAGNQNLYNDCISYEHRTAAYHNSVGAQRARFLMPFIGNQLAVVGVNQSLNVEAIQSCVVSAASAASVSTIAGGQRGQSTRFTFADANTTFNNGANLVTPGGTGFTGSTASVWDGFTPDGTKWYMKQFA